MDEESDGVGPGRTYRSLILAAAVAFMVLPFVTTFNELLTRVVESLRIVAYIQGLAAPFLVKVLVVVLRVLKVPAAARGSYLFLTGSWMPLKVYISWNCTGWQSFILLALTLATGLQGPYTLRSKLLTAALGVEGTFLVNVLRIVVPCLLAYKAGYVPAVLFHDYLGTILTLIWLAAFWYLSFGRLLIREDRPGGAEADE
ncbi:MAG: exosortase/archaeosortase family protein [Candidatus Bathyarchaeia archaeon]